ncbi:LAQU0S07e00760g1_1 [Lachancea quebecensis]|uniref:LAQU0S07e00760g1_1 n=1 Tax=Lachancea quebecensis TaxID=1654605 RepID=A0A0P1KSS4_9SACH|nr:LAQU0S07e00760g1_1 [Lachancea quebecensis]
MSLPEKEFISKFLSLVAQQPIVLKSDFKTPMENITNLGVALPPLKYKYDHKRLKRSGGGGGGSARVQLNLKSIRAPKFVYSQGFDQSDTIYQVKEFLIQKEDSIHEPSQIKVLLKGKVLHDNILLSDLKSDKADLVVMVSKLERAALQSTPADAAANASVGTEEGSPGSAQIPWAKIETLLKDEMANPQEAAAVLQRLQRGWDLADLD